MPQGRYKPIEITETQTGVFHLWEREYTVIGGNTSLIENIQQSIRDGRFYEKYDVADHHCHTDRTDGVFSPSKVVDLAIKQGLTHITITDHNTTQPAIEAREYAEEINDKVGKTIIAVHIGVELSTDSGHVIIVNLPEDLELDFPQQSHNTVAEYQEALKKYKKEHEGKLPLYPGMPLDELIKVANEMKKKNPDIQLIMPHPFDGNKRVGKILRRRGLTNFFGLGHNLSPEEFEEKIGHFDFLEVYNQTTACTHRLLDLLLLGIGGGVSPNKQAEEYFKAKKIHQGRGISGSDTHTGNFQTVMIVPIEEGKSIFDMMKEGQFIIVQRSNNRKAVVSEILQALTLGLGFLPGISIGPYYLHEQILPGIEGKKPNLTQRVLDRGGQRLITAIHRGIRNRTKLPPHR